MSAARSRLGLRGKLFLTSVGMIVVSMVPADLYLTQAVDNLVTDRIHDDLTARMSMASSIAKDNPAALTDVAAWQDWAHRLGEQAKARVSIVRTDGTLIGDSALDRDALGRAENHRERPEIAAAFQGGVGSSARLSATTGERTLYVAGPLMRDGKIIGAVRLALSLAEVEESKGRIHDRLAIAGLLALLVAIVLSFGVAEGVARRARTLAAAARRMAEGDLSTRTGGAKVDGGGTDEFGALGDALDSLASNQSSTLSALRSERDVLGGILASMQEGVLLLDESDRIALVNPALREMLLLGADAVGKSLNDVVHDPELSAVLQKSRHDGATAIGEIDIAGLKPRQVLVRAIAFRAGGLGGPGRLLAVFVDVTELRRLEKLRRDFVANVSHELRTPVTAIRSASETLQDAARNDPAAMPLFVDIIARNAERMRQLVEDLLDLSKIESREYKLDFESVRLDGAVAQAAELFRERADKKSIYLIREVSPMLPAVRADRRALEQVLTNLLENAIKYCTEGSRIRVWAEEDRERFVKLAVEDTGPGIEPKHLPRLFERFYRVDKGRARDVGGTGLGLSIVKHLVEAMGGEVGVVSTVGTGSTFWAVLPKFVAPPAEVAETTAVESPSEETQPAAVA